jgi:hypothetical protein
VVVERIGAQLYSLRYTFSAPPNASEFHYFTGCLAGKLANQQNATYWSLGTIDKDLKYNFSSVIELFVNVQNNEMALQAPVNGKSIYFQEPMKSDSLFNFCSKYIVAKYMWTKK